MCLFGLYVVCFSVQTEAENQLVKLADIITIRPGSTDCQVSGRSKSTRSRSNIELMPVGSATSFSIYHVRRASGHKLRQCRIVFHTSDAGTVTQWVDRVSDILAWPGTGCYAVLNAENRKCDLLKVDSTCLLLLLHNCNIDCQCNIE